MKKLKRRIVFILKEGNTLGVSIEQHNAIYIFFLYKRGL